MAIRFRVRGVDKYVRDLSKTSDEAFMHARTGVEKAAEYLLEKVISKIGVYQPTGGDPKGYGRWKKLKYETVVRKLRRYNVGDKPLLASGALKDSFSVIKGGKGRLSASVGSDSEYLVHHVYGAPGANVPMRDPIRITAIEELDECHKIIADEIIKKMGW